MTSMLNTMPEAVLETARGELIDITYSGEKTRFKLLNYDHIAGLLTVESLKDKDLLIIPFTSIVSIHIKGGINNE